MRFVSGEGFKKYATIANRALKTIAFSVQPHMFDEYIYIFDNTVTDFALHRAIIHFITLNLFRALSQPLSSMFWLVCTHIILTGLFV